MIGPDFAGLSDRSELRLHLITFGAILLASASSAQAAATGSINPPLSPRNASYSIDARLDPDNRAIVGSEVITWRNITSRPAGDLQFHLY